MAAVKHDVAGRRGVRGGWKRANGGMNLVPSAVEFSDIVVVGD